MIQIYLTKKQFDTKQPEEVMDETSLNMLHARRMAMLSANINGFGCVCAGGGIVMIRQYENNESE